MSDGDGEMERTNVFLPVAEKYVLKDRPGTGHLSRACRQGVDAEVYGEEYVGHQVLNEETEDHLELLCSAFDLLRASTEQQSVNGMMAVEQVQKELSDHLVPVVHALARSNHERRKQAETAVETRQTDPEAASPGFEKSPVDATEQMVFEMDGKEVIPQQHLEDGPESPWVRQCAEACGKNPAEFFEFICNELADVLVKNSLDKTPYTVREWMDTNADEYGYEFWQAAASASLRSDMATDGGDSS